MKRKFKSWKKYIVLCIILVNIMMFYMTVISSNKKFSSIKHQVAMLHIPYHVVEERKTESTQLSNQRTVKSQLRLDKVSEPAEFPKKLSWPGKEQNPSKMSTEQPSFWNSKYIHYLMHETQSLRLQIDYDPFVISEPLFINESDRILFYKNKTNLEYMKIPSPKQLRGEIYVIRNGTFKEPYDCGYKSSSDHMMLKRNVTKNNWYPVLVPLNVPDGHTFQHFMDGTLPKIIQAIDFLTYPGTKIVMGRSPRDKILYEMFEKLNLSPENFIFDASRTYGARSLVSSCIAPPIHPQLWKTARQVLGASAQRIGSWHNGTVILMTRSGSFNHGRNMLNQVEVLNMLHVRYGENNVHTFKGPYNLSRSIEIFGKAKIVIGVHGGGLQNIIYCPEGTVVIEIMPTYNDGRLVLSHAGVMYWVQSSMLNLKYWRISMTPLTPTGNVVVDLHKLEAVLNEAEK